jgi:hypothetical protein
MYVYIYTHTHTCMCSYQAPSNLRSFADHYGCLRHHNTLHLPLQFFACEVQAPADLCLNIYRGYKMFILRRR